MRDFEKALGEWNIKNAGDKIWDNFKSHFRAAQVELEEIHSLTMHQAGYHHTNMLAQQLRNDIKNQKTEMLSIVHNLIPVPDQAEYQPELIVQPEANAAINTVQQ